MLHVPLPARHPQGLGQHNPTTFAAVRKVWHAAEGGSGHAFEKEAWQQARSLGGTPACRHKIEGAVCNCAYERNIAKCKNKRHEEAGMAR